MARAAWNGGDKNLDLVSVRYASRIEERLQYEGMPQARVSAGAPVSPFDEYVAFPSR